MVKTPDYQKKYEDVYKMVHALVALFYKNYYGFFKMMSMDKDDIQQEMDYLTWREIEKFERKKFPQDCRISLKYYIKLQVKRKIDNILAENTNHSTRTKDNKIIDYTPKKGVLFVSLNQDDTNKEMDEVDDNSKGNVSVQITEPNYTHFSETDIKFLLKRFSKNELEFNVICDKIVNNLTFEEIQKKYHFKTRNKGEYLYDNVVERIKKTTGGNLDILTKF